MEERRSSPRFTFPETTIGRIFIPDSQISQAAWVRDISAGGVALLLGRSLGSHNLLFVEIKRADQSRELPARLVHSAEQTDGTWLVGCEFVFHLENSDLRTILH
jgi:hypothetical protein